MGIINYFPLHLSRRIWDINLSFPKTWLIIFMSLFSDFSGFAMHHFILVPGRSRFTFYRVRHMKAMRRCERAVICFKCHSCKLYPHLSKSSTARSQHHQLHATLPSSLHACFTVVRLCQYHFLSSSLYHHSKGRKSSIGLLTHLHTSIPEHMFYKLWFRFMYASCLLFSPSPPHSSFSFPSCLLFHLFSNLFGIIRCKIQGDPITLSSLPSSCLS